MIRNMILARKLNSKWKFILSARSISYVERSRLLDKIKNDDEFCKSQMESGKYLLYSKGQPLLQKSSGPGSHRPSFLSYAQCDRVSSNLAETSVLLGVEADGTPRFAALLSKDADPHEVEAENLSKFVDLRVGLFMVESDIAQTLSRGWSLLMWNKKHNFCSSCGSKLNRSLSGASCRCSSCSEVFYPSTSPVGIVSITDREHQHLLLIRQPMYPKGMFSCIAGFLDVGETIEDCVRREVAEEVGIEVEDDIKYNCSQHWPFPSGSLMIGCQAVAVGGLPTPDPCKLELEDARWFSREEVAQAVRRIDHNPRLRVGRNNNPEEIFIAPRGAIAYSLITSWLKNET